MGVLEKRVPISTTVTAVVILARVLSRPLFACMSACSVKEKAC